MENYSTNYKDYEIGKVIGQGATAIVVAAKFKPQDRPQTDCAIKRINLDRKNENLNDIAKEVQYMLMCRHENIVRYYKSFVVRDELWLIMNLLGGGSVYDIIKYRMEHKDAKRDGYGVMEENEIATILNEALKGLEYLHANGQIHRDIKAGNILLGLDGSVQLGDFGVSAMISMGAGDRASNQRRETFVGTVCWMAPEVMEQAKGYDYKADIWSLGIVGIEMVTGAAPYNKYPPMKVILLTLQNTSPTLDTVSKDNYKKYSKEIRKFIAKCLQKEPTKRPAAVNLLKDSFLKKAEKKPKEFIVNNMLNKLPKVTDRAKKTRRVPGSSGKMHRCQDDTWEFSDPEEVDDPNQKTVSEQRTPRCPETQVEKVDQVDQQDIKKHRQYTLTLRIRSRAGDLQDVSFPFITSIDTASAVSQEMMQSGIIENEDTIIVASKISDLVEKHENHEDISKTPENERMTRFRCKTGIADGDEMDETELRGFAQLTIGDQ